MLRREPVVSTPSGGSPSGRRGAACAPRCSRWRRSPSGLTTPVMIKVADVDTPIALGVGLGLAVPCLLIAGMLRGEWAYALGWLVQLGAIGLGFVIGLMFFLGALFALLWATAYLLGRKIERERAAAYAAFEAEQQ